MTDYIPDEYTAKQMYVLQRQSMHNHISPDYGAEFDRFINKVRAEAWDEGQEAGWNEAEECWAVEGMVGDFHKHSNVPNPYRIEGEIK